MLGERSGVQTISLFGYITGGEDLMEWAAVHLAGWDH